MSFVFMAFLEALLEALLVVTMVVFAVVFASAAKLVGTRPGGVAIPSIARPTTQGYC